MNGTSHIVMAFLQGYLIGIDVSGRYFWLSSKVEFTLAFGVPIFDREHKVVSPNRSSNYVLCITHCNVVSISSRAWLCVMLISEEPTAEGTSLSSGAQLCPLCGICYSGGPTSLTSLILNAENEDTIARAFLANLTSPDQALGLHLPEDTQELLSTIHASVKACHAAMSDWRGSQSEDSRWSCSTWVAIGYFDEDGQAPVERYRTRVFVPDGSNVTVRQVTDSYYASFQNALSDGVGADGMASRKVWHDVISNCDIEDDPTCPNIAMCLRCFYYLKAWLDGDTLPLPSDGRRLSFAGELYEIVNSQDSRGELCNLHV